MKKEKTKEDLIIDQILENNEMVTAKDVSDVLDTMYGRIVQRLLDAEMDNHLGYSKSSREEKDDNRRNGYSSKGKKVKTDKGVITIDMPRDRDGSFNPIILQKRQRVLAGYDDIVIGMYAKGLTQEDIKEMIKKIYKIDISKELISNLISSVNDEVKAWQNRTLQNIYPFVYIDCLYVPIREDLVSEKTAVYVMLGIGLDGKKEVLGVWIDGTESATYWTTILEEIKDRGVKDIFVISLDGLTGLPEAINTVYPQTNTQRCVVHIVRNIYKVCNKKEAKEVINDFKKIYRSDSLEQAQLEYQNFTEKYKDKKAIIKKIKDNIEHIFGLYDYPQEIRKVIYTTNPIESLNSAIRKVTNGKGSFPTKESVFKVLYLRIRDLEKKWSKGTLGWKVILNQLIEIYGERITKYLEV